MKINGNIGGGSVLRIAVPLAVAHNIPITVTNIRKQRKKPGLRLQHLLGLQLLQSISSAHATGLVVGSETISFTPSELSSQSHFELQISTAASLSLIIQTLQNYMAARSTSITDPISVHFHGGGTHVNWSPTAEYVQYVTAPYLSQFGITLDYLVQKVGFFPRGGAEAFCTLKKVPADHPVLLTNFSNDTELHAHAVVSEQLRNRKVAERMLYSFSSTNTTIDYVNAAPGAALTAFAGTLPRGTSHVGEKRMSSEAINHKVVKELKDQLQTSAVDVYMSDQILVPLAYAPSESVAYIRDTNHVRTNLQVLETFFRELFDKPVFSVTSTSSFLIIRKL